MTIGKFEIDSIIDMWVARFGFNPISDVYRHEILCKRHCTNCGLYFYNYRLPDSTNLYHELVLACDYYPFYRWEYGQASAYILKNRPKSLIEIGAGKGHFLERVKEIVPVVFASEYNKGCATACQQKGIAASDKDISSINEKYDVVCAFEVLEHVTDTHEFMKNLIHLLNPKGKIIFGTPDPEGILTITGVTPLNLPPHHQYDFSLNAYEYLAKMYHLKIVEYKKSDLVYRIYARYVKQITKMDLQQPDIMGFLETRKQYTGPSHFVVFEKL